MSRQPDGVRNRGSVVPASPTATPEASLPPQAVPNYVGIVFDLLLAGLTLATAKSLSAVSLKTWALAFVLYFLGVLAESAGYHRLWAHRSYEASPLLRLFFAMVGAGNFTGPITGWVRNHRAHHRQVDTSRDPFNRNNGFLYAFLGHRYINKAMIGEASTSDLEADPIVQLQWRFYPVLAILFGLGLPAAIASLWGDLHGGLYVAGILRVFLFTLVQSFLWAYGRTSGRRPYSEASRTYNNVLVAIMTLGDGYLNFHYQFPSDYRIGCFYYHFDLVKWIIRFFSFLGLASNLSKTRYDNILRLRVQRKQQKLDEIRHSVEFGPDPQSLPVWTWEQFEERVANGEQLLIIDNLVHDIKGFYDEHPGGAEVLRPKIGKDATIAFNGGVQRHSKAARNLASFMRIAVMKDQRKPGEKRHLSSSSQE